METLRIPDGLEEVDVGLFQNSRLKKVVIPSSVRMLGRAAFSNCQQLDDVVFEPGSRLESIGDNCFSCCCFERISLPGSVRSIGDGAFKYCYRLKEFELAEENQLSHVGRGAFEGTAIGEDVIQYLNTLSDGRSVTKW